MNTQNTKYGAEKITFMLKDAKKLFFVGIGGINMCSLSAIAKARGYEVSGSDRSSSPTVDRLVASGITVYGSHRAENISGADALIYTVSIPTDNPEYVEAGRRGIPRISRADFLGWLMHSARVRIGVSGMHGKSTATGMCASILTAAGVDPTISSGADMPDLGCSYRLGQNEYFLYEACEYKDSFLSFYPTHALILNIDMDHPDYFRDLDAVKSSFRKCLSIVDGVAVVNYGDENVRDVISGYEKPVVRFGTDRDVGICASDCEFFAHDISLTAHSSSFSLSFPGGECMISLSEAGLHNVRDAAGAVAVCMTAGIGIDAVKAGLESFRGAARRMEFIGKSVSGADIYLDYAHHPTEIAATLSTARALGGRLITVFQPHTYTRTKALYDEFVRSLSISDKIVVADIYAARERDEYGVSSSMLTRSLLDAGADAVYAGELENEPGGNQFPAIAAYISDNAMSGDTVIIMGAGDINAVAKMTAVK